MLDCLKRGGRWVILVGVFLTAAETGARIEDWVTWGAPIGSSFSEDRLTVRDSVGVHGHPGYRYKKWRMNNLGFRGPDTKLEATNGRTRIVLLGASETFGLYESEHHEYAVRLQALLDSMAPGRYEIVNAGLPGLSLSSMVPYYRNLVARLRPAYVLIYPSPSFYLEVNPLPPTYVIPPVGRHSADPSGNRWRLPPRAKETFKSLIPSPLISRVRLRSLEQQRQRHPGDWVWPTVPAERMVILRHHVEILIDSIAASGVQPVLVTHTNRFVGAPADTLTSASSRLTDLASLYYPRASKGTMVAVDSVANGVLRSVASGRGITVFEVEGRIPSTNAYFADYAHFTDLGAEAMARLLAENILALPSSDSPALVQP